MTATKNQKIVIETASVIAGITIFIAVLSLMIFPSEVSEVPPSEELVITPIIDSLTPTPTPTPSPTPAVSVSPTPTPIPIPIPSPALFYWGTGGGGGGYRAPRIPPEELTGLQICDANGENCTEKSFDSLIKAKNICPGYEEEAVFQLKNDNNKDGTIYVYIDEGLNNSECGKYIYLEFFFDNKSVVTNIADLTEPVKMQEIRKGELLLIKTKWNVSWDSGNELQGAGIGKFPICFGLL